MNKIFPLLTLFLLSFPAYAQEKSENKYDVCKLLPKHTPADDVAYQAGADVNGNAVVPADLNAAPMAEVLNVIKVPLNVDLAQNVAALQEQGIQLEAPLGMLDIYQDGRVLYNGQDWTTPVMMLCGKSHKVVTEEIIEVLPTVEPTAPIAPKFNEAADIEKPVLPNELVIESPEEAIEMPAVSAPVVEEAPAPPKVSQPPEPIRPLIGTPKGASKTKAPASGIIQGQDYRD